MASTVDLIKERLSVADVVGSYIQLQKAGNSFKAKCPFHNEKTPSFFVSPDRGGYYCFGCGAKGDIFTFVQEFEGVDFMGALKILGAKAGVEVIPENPREKNEREKLFNLMEAAVGFFESNLKKNKKALEYLNSRGLKEKTIKDWRLGFASDEWREALTFLAGKGFSRNEIVKAGIIKEENGKAYDRFRSRIMFPIFDSAGRPVAFSGRIFGKEDDKSPKYLNSPETELFSKSRVLFGFDRAKTEIRRLDYCILVEGQMDLLICHERGYRNTVASSGTALTADHLSLINRLTKKTLFVFDADSAGVSATLRGAVTALSLGMEVKVAALPQGTDPAELIVKDEKKWRDCLKSSKQIIDFYLDAVVSSNKDERSLLREIKGKVLPYVKALESGIDRSHYLKKIAKVAQVSEKAVAEDLEKAKPFFDVDKFGAEEMEGNEKKHGSVESMAEGVLFWQKSLKKPDIDIKVLEDDIKRIIGKKRHDIYLKDDTSDLAFKAEFYYGGRGDLDVGMKELLLNLEEEILKGELSVEIKKIGEAEKKKDSVAVNKAMLCSRDLSRRLDEIKNKRYLSNR